MKPCAMGKDPAIQRFKLDNEAPAKTPAAVADDNAAPPSLASAIDSLSDDMLRNCFSFIGKGHYRYVALTNRRFHKIYSTKINREKRTSWNNVVVSVACAELCLQDEMKKKRELTKTTLKTIFEHALKIGNVQVLDLANDKGYEPKESDFHHVAINGNIAALSWAQKKGIDWFSFTLIDRSAANGHAHVFDLVHATGRLPNASCGIISRTAASSGQSAVLAWLKDHDQIDEPNELWAIAAEHNHIGVLDWLWGNGSCRTQARRQVIPYAAEADSRDALIWARDHGLPWKRSYIYAVHQNNLPLIQWLRRNDCPWSSSVIRDSRSLGYDDIAEWAIANGCPTE